MTLTKWIDGVSSLFDRHVSRSTYGASGEQISLLLEKNLPVFRHDTHFVLSHWQLIHSSLMYLLVFSQLKVEHIA